MSWIDMTDDEIKAAIKEIVRTSESDDEIQRRVTEELGNPNGMVIVPHLPTGTVSDKERDIMEMCGYLIRKDGATIKIHMYGPRGNTLSISHT